MRKLIVALLAAGVAAGSAPALAHDGYRDRHEDRYDRQAEQYARAAERTRRVQEANSRRIYRETARAQARNSERLRREGLARNRANEAYARERYERTYGHDEYAYYDEAAFRRFADRNRDGRVSRAEYEWAERNW